MKVAVVIPAFNSLRFLPQAVESVLAQSFQDWEVVIVDDGSSDGTHEVARGYADRDGRVRFLRQPHSGAAAARNRGFAAADAGATYVMFLDHDDVWHADALELLVEALDARPHAVAATGLARFVDEHAEPVWVGQLQSWGRQRVGVSGDRLVAWPLDQPTPFAVLAYANRVATMGVALYRRSAFAAAGLFDPLAEPCDDWDMHLRMSLRGDFVFVDRVVLDWRRHADNASRRRSLMAERETYVRAKLLSSAELSGEQRRVARVANRYWRRKASAAWARLALRSLAGGEAKRAAAQFRSAIRCCAV